MKYIFLVVVIVISLAHITKSNTSGVYNDVTNIRSSGIEKKSVQKSKKRELKKKIREENLKKVEPGTVIGPSTI